MARKKQEKPEQRTQRGKVVSVSDERNTKKDGTGEDVINIEFRYKGETGTTYGQITCYGEAIPKASGFEYDADTLDYELVAIPVEPDHYIEVSGNFSKRPFKKAKKAKYKNRLKDTWTIYYPEQLDNFGLPKANWKAKRDSLKKQMA